MKPFRPLQKLQPETLSSPHRFQRPTAVFVRFCCLFLVFDLLFTSLPLWAADVISFDGKEKIIERGPTDTEISMLRIFEEPLIPMHVGVKSEINENSDLKKALDVFLVRSSPEDDSALTSFLAAHPDSKWAAALWGDMGLMYFKTGWFSKSLVALENGWNLSKNETELRGKLFADRIVAELIQINARLGRCEQLETLLKDVENREFAGPATEKVSLARGGMWMMDHETGESFRCGPMALDRIRAWLNPHDAFDPKIQQCKSTKKGTSLVQIRDLSRSVGMDYQMARRGSGAEILLPSVVHWKVGHFAALLKKDKGYYMAQDPTFGSEFWVSQAALDAESSGYFLVPPRDLPQGWQAVSNQEGQKVWGKGNTSSFDSEQFKDSSDRAKPCPVPKPMADYNIHSLLVSLNIFDTPVSYTPPKGPDVHFRVTYNQRDSIQPSNPSYSNLGSKWCHNWFSYLQDTPANPAASIQVFLRNGGAETYTGFDSQTTNSVPHRESRAILVRTSSSPISYERHMPDGSKEIYSQNGGGSPTRTIFLTSLVDPFGNAVSLNYDGNQRLTGIVDAIGQTNVVEHYTNSVGAPGFYSIKKVTDPFSRFATFAYDSSWRLTNITDVIGINSSFSYVTNDFINTLTTPYGTTTFTNWESGVNRVLVVTDPLGNQERVEFKHSATGIATSDSAGTVPAGVNTHNDSLDYRNTFYWDKRAMKLYPGDYTRAVIKHWLHTENTAVVSGILESEKLPLENRVWFDYAGQSDAQIIGSQGQPSTMGRVLEDGSTQRSQFEYNSVGKVTRRVDPMGRDTIFLYANNNLDLVAVKQKAAGGYETLARYTYNGQHLPLTAIDASGQTTTFTYNNSGQVLTITNPKSEVTTFNYNGSGYLTNMVGAVTGAITTFTYDSAGRVRTVKDSENYVLTYDYDDANRITKVTYPDATYKQTQYNLLDLDWTQDRLQRKTYFTYNALRQLTNVKDPLNQNTKFDWCGCGSLESLTDAKGQKTTWFRDLEGRVTQKLLPDLSVMQYFYESTSARVKYTMDAKGQTTTYQYYSDDNLKSKAYSGTVTPSVNFTYDQYYNRVTSMADGVGVTTYAYNPVGGGLGSGLLKLVDGPLSNDTISYDYDALGRVKSRSINSVTNSMAYDALGRVTGVTNSLGGFVYTYTNQTSRLISLAYPNGQTNSYAYFSTNGDFRLQQIINRDSTGGVVTKFDYAYNAEGQMTNWTQQQSITNAFNLSYDAVDRLIANTVKDGVSQAVVKRYVYGYDQAGNRTLEKIDDAMSSASFNAGNQLTGLTSGGVLSFEGRTSQASSVNVAGGPATMTTTTNFSGSAQMALGTNTVSVIAMNASGSVATNKYQVVINSGSNQTLVYDANGNLAEVQTNSAVQVSYEWDAANRLIAINESPTNRTEFVYDGLGRRAKITEKLNGSTTLAKRLLWCDSEICEERNSAGDTVNKRYFGQGFQLGTTNYFCSVDHLGSIRSVMDSAGTNVVSRYDYDPYGRRTLVSGSDIADFGFTGHYFHQPSGLHLAMYRAYDANLGRWLSRDPIAESGGVNLYGYVKNNPTTLVDLFGLRILPTKFIGPIGPNDQRGLTPVQENALRELVKREQASGTIEAAKQSSITFGDRLMEPFNSSRGNTVPTSYGDMDLDWFTDVSSANYMGRYSAIPAYVFGKLSWTGIREATGAEIGNPLPFEDSGERAAILALIEDNSFGSLFDDEFFKIYGAEKGPCDH